MLTLKCSTHIRTNRNLMGFHGCSTSTGPPFPTAGISMTCGEDASLRGRELRRRWLARLWMKHLERIRPSRTSEADLQCTGKIPHGSRKGKSKESGK